MAATADDVAEDEAFRMRGEMLVRRFTDSLNGDTALEQATVAAQNQDDQIVQESHESRMRALYDDQGHDDLWVSFKDLRVLRG